MIYDLIVIGAGPAGMIAGGRAAENGARVLILEKNDKVGIKLLLTGKGRCNITNAEADNRKFIELFGTNGKFLFSSMHRFNTADAVNFFEKLGVKTKVERGNRVFPISDKSRDVVSALFNYLKKHKVEIRTNSEVARIKSNNNKIDSVVLSDKKKYSAKNYLICTGGKSYPLSGSTGDAYSWLTSLGHTVVKPAPALTPLVLKQSWISDLEGLSLKNVNINVYQKDKKKDSRFGEALFTANGISGPIILDMSKSIGTLLENGSVELSIDFKPALDSKVLDKRIQKDFSSLSNKMFKNSLDMLLPKKLIPIIIKQSGIDGEKKVNSITRQERKILLNLLKDFKLNVSRLSGFERAVVTSGGVSLSEIDPKTMQSKIIENLYLAGEVLDLDGPTGGFNLQVCWATGYTVGEQF
jgi:predicted Rossmann fold flavoprotein